MRTKPEDLDRNERQAAWRLRNAKTLKLARQVASALVAARYPRSGSRAWQAVEREQRLARVADTLRTCLLLPADCDRLAVMLGMTAKQLQTTIKRQVDAYTKREGKS